MIHTPKVLLVLIPYFLSSYSFSLLYLQSMSFFIQLLLVCCWHLFYPTAYSRPSHSIHKQLFEAFNSDDPGSHKNDFQLATRGMRHKKWLTFSNIHTVTVWDGSSNVKWYAATSFTLKLLDPLMTTLLECKLNRTELIAVDSNYLFFNVPWLQTHPSAQLKISC